MQQQTRWQPPSTKLPTLSQTEDLWCQVLIPKCSWRTRSFHVTTVGSSQLVKYIQQKHQLSDNAALRIDWTSHAQDSYSTPPLSKTNSVSAGFNCILAGGPSYGQLIDHRLFKVGALIPLPLAKDWLVKSSNTPHFEPQL
jgi:hypothetical protein